MFNSGHQLRAEVGWPVASVRPALLSRRYRAGDSVLSERFSVDGEMDGSGPSVGGAVCYSRGAGLSPCFGMGFSGAYKYDRFNQLNNLPAQYR